MNMKPIIFAVPEDNVEYSIRYDAASDWIYTEKWDMTQSPHPTKISEWSSAGWSSMGSESRANYRDTVHQSTGIDINVLQAALTLINHMKAE